MITSTLIRFYSFKDIVYKVKTVSRLSSATTQMAYGDVLSFIVPNHIITLRAIHVFHAVTSREKIIISIS